MAICGIAVNREARPVSTAEIEGMVSALAVQQDWQGGRKVEAKFGFGFTSPIATTSIWTSPQVAVSCDADIYNQESLKRSLKDVPADANLACLLGTLYLEHGQDFLKDLRGAFVLAVWDLRSEMLILATDRFGVKPLCYSATSEEIIFASQPRGILATGRVTRAVSMEALVQYLNFTAVPAPLSAFEGIRKLPPATCLIWKDGSAKTQSYWEMNYPENANGPTEQLARELLGRMEEAVSISSNDANDSKLGCFLSGGTDSSSVVGLLTRIRKSPVTSLTIGFEEERFNELTYAMIAAKHFGSDLIVSRLGPADAFRILPKMIALYDEPFANSSCIPTYHCHMLARERGIEIMLAGDGGDELFGGNERYRTEQIYGLYKKIPGAFRRSLIEPVMSHVSLGGPGLAGKVRRYIEVSNTPNPERYFRWSMLQHFSPENILGTAMPFRNGHSDLLAIARSHYKAAPAHAELNRLMYLDVKMTLGDNDLPKVARTAELAGVNVRFPYLDHPLAEFSGRIPVALKVKGLEKRFLFKKATRDLLPKAILEKKKHGFGLPMGMWLKTDVKMRGMAQDVLHDPRTYQRGYFQRDFIEKTFAAMDHDETPYYGDILWPFLVLELWHRHHVEGKAS
jgi:asparagine synthase (glutamine-hydrolysing)